MSVRPPAAASGLVPGAVASVRFTDLLANGQAVGRLNGFVVFVTGPLPGEHAKVRIVQVKPKYAVADVVAYERESEYRTRPFCGVFGVCGGCQVQHLAYPAQLAWKEQIVRSALRRIGGFAGVEVRRPVGMTSPRNYRNKMALVVEHAGGEPVYGFYQARSHALVPIESCPVVLPQLDAAIGGLYAAARAPQSRAAFAGAKHAIVRAGASSGQAVLSITTERRSPDLAAEAPEIARRIRGIVGISNSFEPRTANAVLGRKMLYVWGRREMEESIEGVRYRVSPASFFQVNSEMVGRIFRFLAPALQPGRTIVDLYCGAGTFAIFFASRGATVVGIEENPAAVREARENAKINDVGDRVTFVEGRVEGTVAHSRGKQALEAAEIVFLDPPRKGSDEATLAAIADARVASVWYLSCNPATLARDLAYLAKRGYALGVVQPFDMFPQTGHVETLVTLRRIDAEPEAALPEREPTPWDDQIPVWPPEDPYAKHEYPEFVDKEPG
ncbi:putative RNA methyltransferase [Vulcanimicrobium alpinum]|uniref:RNA methyltransferase n=1 Tax=Vulcanimicrobium alpinum TaxID=3016050 RepID=A0AAN2C9J1_UNVUL|nr:23S rRNA (uracil(1939)-C(5))-methyltransferase RlmD [Vulcanimicrobium alpinum]BDE06043.1 putative RNA methyltransferase [Vulcanimicrobium alpinum]